MLRSTTGRGGEDGDGNIGKKQEGGQRLGEGVRWDSASE